MRTLIYESGYTGHRREYIRHLMNFISNRSDLHGKYTFLLNKSIQIHLQEESQANCYETKYISYDSKFSNSLQRSFSEWKLITKILDTKPQFTEIVFLDIDPFLFLITTNQFKKYNLTVRGILFEPYVHYKENNDGLWFFFRHVLRSYLTQIFAAKFNKKIGRIFILNDEQSIRIMNRSINKIFYYLPDPIDFGVDNINAFQTKFIKEKYNIITSKKNLLLFGSMDHRKNLITIVNSLLLLPDSIRANTHLIIAGKFQIDSKERYLDHIHKHNNDISISYNDEFISDEEREVLFENCDIVLMPYINFYSSSGILGHTIKHNKFVVASNRGLVGRLVTENNLGVTVDPMNEVEIMGAILSIFEKLNKVNEYEGKKLLTEYSPSNFSRTLLTL